MNTCSKVPCGFQCSVWKRPASRMQEVPLEALCLGSVFFSQPALLWVLPAGFHELAVTFLNLDTSSMEAYYIYIYIFCLRRAVFSIAQILTASNEYAHRATLSPHKHHFVARSWALGAQDLSRDQYYSFVCSLFINMIWNQGV